MCIDPRFNGPPASGNGGYSCGLLAAHLDGPAEVSLRLPPPLDKNLTVERTTAGVRALDGDSVVLEAVPTRLELTPPPAPSSATARAASEASPFRDERHPFPTCFTCGPHRDAGDGLRVFIGPLPDAPAEWASTWTPLERDAGEDGAVRPEIVWAALDCPTSGPCADPEGHMPVVLARLTASIDGPVRPGAEHTIRVWPLGRDGRKREAACAIYDPAGIPVARSRALWIELKAEDAAAMAVPRTAR